jgi:hypothetical protein
MRSLRFVLALALVVSGPLVGTVTLAHAHDASTPGLYNSQCPLNEAAGHTLASQLDPPAVAPLDAATILLPPAREWIALDAVPSPAAPRAPPLS